MSDDRLSPLRQVLDAAKTLGSLGLPVAATTSDGTVVFWNSAADTLYGRAAEQALGRSVVDLLFPLPAGSRAAGILEALAHGTTWSGDFPVRRTDGEDLVVRVVGSPVLDVKGVVFGCVGVSRDITREVSTERALRDSRDALRLALSAGRLGTWKWDMAAGTVQFDRQLEAIFGLPAGGFDGRFDTYQALLHPDDRGYVLQVVRAAVATKSDYDVEHRCVWSDGSVHWLQGRGSVTLDTNGEVSGTVGCVGDMTDRVLARSQAADLSASLQAGLLPQLASPPGMTVRSRYRPGEERLLLGGDFLDVAMTPSGNVAFCIGDVGGHGAIPAAVGTSLRAGWRALALTGDDPRTWLAGCADVFAAGNPPYELFVTMTTGFVSADHRRLVLLSAGHPLPVLLGDRAAHTLVVDTCPPLGLLSKDALGQPTTVDLPDRWALIMFTDGLFVGYARAGTSERLGVDRIERWCSELDGSPMDEDQLDGLLAFVEDANGGPLSDDIGVLAISSTTTSSEHR